MRNTKRFQLHRAAAAFSLLGLMLIPAPFVEALGSSNPNQSTSTGLEARISAPAPTQAATIVTPARGQNFSDTPITVSGFCKTGLIVKVFSNNVFVGAATCSGNSYSLKIDLFNGQNDLVARVYDSLDQAGPDSNVVTVFFNDAQYAQFGTRVSLSSTYARKGATPGSELSWPIVLSGGAGPYAISVDWGDSKEDSLYSISFPGSFNIYHTYDTAGVYNVVVKATDGNKTNAYLQLIGVATGETGTATTSASKSNGGGTVIVNNGFMAKYGWYLILAMFPLMGITFWLGSRHELYTIRRRIERSRQQA